MPNRRPVYRAIIEFIRDGITAGRFDATRRLPSEMELARKFRTSRPTVVRAMHELQNLNLIERRVGSGTFIRPSSPVPSAPTALGLIVSGLGNTEILDPICAEIARGAEARNHTILRGQVTMDAASSDFSPEQADTLCQYYIQQRVAGVFFAPLELPEDRCAVNQRIAESLESAGIAAVLLDRDVPDFPLRSRFDLVGIDNFTAGFQLATHILQTGRRHLRFVAKPRYPSTTDHRIAGCREAMARHGLTLTPDDCSFGDPADPGFVKALFSRRKPDGIICSNDLTAAVLMQSLAKLGIRVPADLAVAGFDDVRYATLLSVPLTTMRQPCRAIGTVAVETMLQRIQIPTLPPRQILLSTELVSRRSTAAE